MALPPAYTKVERSYQRALYERSFANLQSLPPNHRLGSHVISLCSFHRQKRNDAHECRCESILEMEGLAFLKNAWSFDILLAFWESS